MLYRLAPQFGRWGELLRMIRRAFASMDGVIDPPSSVHRLTEDGLRQRAEDEIGIVALMDQDIVGCVFLAEKDDHLYLGKLAVDPGKHGHGIGRRLVVHAEEIARTAGKTALELQTRIELTANHAAFDRLGFVETERTAHAGFDRPTTITMRKRFV
ncbi:GNAT family N-acetyltransferase [Mesorhizobium sp. CAU 1732]|uniref:GNAT family N-acetyltransferase n=1 Tax=Mesorhizobium sp. CAU 1732 TaxID=3140358 RepID=UPI003261AC09